MEKNFSNSVFFELKSYQGFVLDPVQINEVLFDKKSSQRTEIAKSVLMNGAMRNFIREAKIFIKGNTFVNILQLNIEQENNLKTLKNCFNKVLEDFETTYEKYGKYYSYVYATLILSILLAMPGYIAETILYEFMYFCRKNFILNI